MDKRNAKAKPFILNRVLDGFRGSVGSSSSKGGLDVELEETLRSEHFQISENVRHGFPYQPTAMAFDPVQRLLIIGTKTGSLRILGQPGVDQHVKHKGDVAVLQIIFLINEGGFVTACSDDQLHLWNFRQKKPEIVHSLQFTRERITCCHLPFQSKWLYVGTERGNVHIVNIESFALSKYIINWNKLIDVLQKNHPGQVVHLSDCPTDQNKLLIGFECGVATLWDLTSKSADIRWNTAERLRSISWNQDGKQFVCSHDIGALSYWSTKSNQRVNIMFPHAKEERTDKPEPCRTIPKVEWRTSRNSDPYVIFTGGQSFDSPLSNQSLTVMHKGLTVLEMDQPIVDFIPLCSSPWLHDFQDPHAIAVLLENELTIIDLSSPSYPVMENPYPMDISESPVTACRYYVDCPHALVPAFYAAGQRAAHRKKGGYSSRHWPITGGQWGMTSASYAEIIITGHEDGSLKFWDASTTVMQVLCKLKTKHMFERHRNNKDTPLAVRMIEFCCESMLLCVAGVSFITLFKFNQQDTVGECTVLEVSIVYDIPDDTESPTFDHVSSRTSLGYTSQQSGSVGSYSSAGSEGHDKEVAHTTVSVKPNPIKWPAGYHASLSCLLLWIDKEPAPPVTSLAMSSKYGLLAFGNECGIAIVDFIQKCCLITMGTPDLYGSMDPYSRAPRSPKYKNNSVSSSQFSNDECKSPTSDYGTGLPGYYTHHSVHTSRVERALSYDPSHHYNDYNFSQNNREMDMQEQINAVLADLKELDDDGDDGQVLVQQTDSEVVISKPSDVDHEAVVWKKCTTRDVDSPHDVSSPSDNELYSSVQPEDPSRQGDGNNSNNLPERPGLVRKISKKVRVALSSSGGAAGNRREEGKDEDVFVSGGKTHRPVNKFAYLDMSVDDGPMSPTVKKMSYSEFIHTEGSLSRSRSSSVSSLENVSKEALQTLTFADVFTRKMDSSSYSSLWIGTSLGSVLALNLQIPTENRKKDPVVVSPSGTIFRLKGSIRVIFFIIFNGQLNVLNSDRNMSRDTRRTVQFCRAESTANMKATHPSFETCNDKQLVVICSERHARVVALPSQTVAFKHKVTDTSSVAVADVIFCKDSVCLACYVANGHIMIFSLPSLRPLLDVDYLMTSDISHLGGCYEDLLDGYWESLFVHRISQTFQFDKFGNCLYFCSPSELQKLTLSADLCAAMQESQPELFVPCDTPEAPRQSIMKSLFGATNAAVDRDILFGELGGNKSSSSVAKYTAGTAGLNDQAGAATSEIGRARDKALERGEKLGELSEATERLRASAENYASSAHQLANKYQSKSKKWWPF